MLQPRAVLASTLLLFGLCADDLAPIPAQAAEIVLDLAIQQGRVASHMRTIRVQQGDTVRLRWSTDRPIILHLHGYDIESRVEPGQVTEMTFVARVTGRFPVEEHRPGAHGGHSHAEAALVRIEVRPR